MTEITGIAPQRFARVKDAFAALFDQGLELGAQFALAVDGEVVVDLQGGFADRARTRPVAADTLFPVFSTGKAVMALMMARLVEAGKLGYDQTIASVWPEFGQAGKAGITLAQALSHQSGLPGFSTLQDPTIWFDREAVLQVLAAQAPMWPPGTASGYHPVTIGFLMGEVFRRADGRSMGQALAQDFRLPRGIDCWIGLPETEHGRIVEIQKPSTAVDLGDIDAVKRAAFLDRGSAPGGRGTTEWRMLEIPSANAHATAPALARLLGVIATRRTDGRQGGAVASGHGPGRARTDLRPRQGPALHPVLGRRASCATRGSASTVRASWRSATPAGAAAAPSPTRRRGSPAAYVMNRQSAHLIGDPRPLKLIEAVCGATVLRTIADS